MNEKNDDTREEARRLLAPSGTLRAAINLGNAALAQQDPETGVFGGVSTALARALAEDLGVELSINAFTSAGKVASEAAADTWDIAFLAIDPKRAETIAYTSPYVLIESSYAVPVDSPDTECAALDRPGAKLLVARNSAYDLHMSRTIEHATLERAGSPGESFALYKERPEDFTAVAGVRESLEKAFGNDPAYRILPDAIAAISQAMAVPREKSAALAHLNAFIEARKADGFVRTALDESGRGSLKVAPAATD